MYAIDMFICIQYMHVLNFIVGLYIDYSNPLNLVYFTTGIQEQLFKQWIIYIDLNTLLIDCTTIKNLNEHDHQ